MFYCPPPLPVGGAPGTDQAPGQCDHEARREDAQHAAQQHREPGHHVKDMASIVTQYSPLHLLLHHLVFLGAAELVLGRPTAEDVLVIIAGGAIEASVPLAGGVNVARAVLRAQDG